MKKVCKTVQQYNKHPVSKEDMQKLLAIAWDYREVKNYVYARYGGIGNLTKLYPGYTVQNEMTKSGLRERLGLPSVYFYLAVFDALKDIKSQWTRTKAKLSKRIAGNESFTKEEKHYLYFLLKTPNAFESVLNQKPPILDAKLQGQYEKLAALVDAVRLHRYLCRQVRKVHQKLHTEAADAFSITERAYRYGDHGIYISIKEKRKRIFLPLTDHNQYTCQMRIKLFPQEDRIEIKVPIQVSIRRHADYRNQVGIAFGFHTMLTTDEGRRYGAKLGKYQMEYADWLRAQTICHQSERDSNPGRKKYRAKKRRLEEELHSYINHELNVFLQREKPQIIYMVKPPPSHVGGVNRKINYSIAIWQRGYIRNRLKQKCQRQSVQLTEVFGKGVGETCSRCNAAGLKKDGQFHCPVCNCRMDEKTNTARNVKKRGQGDKMLH